MKGKFERAIEVVLEHEGGFVHHPSDPGGATNWGVSLRFLRSLGDEIGDVDGDGDVDWEDVAKMPREHAVNIYRSEWWEKYRYESIEDLALATKVFDLAVNMGPGQAHRLLQRALNRLGQSVLVDGILGPKTMKAVNKAEPQKLLAALREEAASFYRELVRKKPKLRRFLKGWLRRAQS